MHDFLVSAVAFLVLVGIMVLVHELGHFVVAKLCKVRVEAFAFGFGPRLFGFKYGETDYKVCLLPLGGFVKMTGENPGEEAPVDDPGAFVAHPRWQRMLIGLAGPAANFVLAFAAMFFYYGVINEVPVNELKSTTVEWVTADSAAGRAGLRPGDVIRDVEHARNVDWEVLYERLKLNANQTVPLTVERDGQLVTLSLKVPAEAKQDEFDISDAGILPQLLRGPVGVSDVLDGEPAAQAGIRAGDQIVTLDGHAVHSVSSLLAYLQEGKGAPVHVTLVRGGAPLDVTVHPAKLDAGWKLGFKPVPVPFRNDPLPLGRALAKTNSFCADKAGLIFEVLNRLFTHKASVSQLAGPVGIARMAGEAAEMKGWAPKFGLGAFISINLGIVNLLPFPILDGGMILLLLIESTIRRDISMAVKERIYQAAFVVLVVFFAFIIVNDVSKLSLFSKVKP